MISIELYDKLLLQIEVRDIPMVEKLVLKRALYFEKRRLRK